MTNNKKIIVPVVALMLCTIAVIGIGYAYQGTYSDSAESKDMNVHWVKVNSTEQIKIDPTNYKIDVDTESDRQGTTYAFSKTQNHNGVVADDGSTITFKNIKIGTLNFSKSTDGADSGKLKIELSDNTSTNVEVKLVESTAEAFTVGTPVDVYVDIIIKKAAIENGENVVSTPAFKMTVTATAEE